MLPILTSGSAKVLRGDADVAEQRQFQAAAQRHAVDRRNHRLGQIEVAHQAAVVAVELGRRSRTGRRRSRQIGARAECLVAGSDQNGGPLGRIGIESEQRRFKRISHIERQGVARVGAIQGDDRDEAAAGHEDIHQRTSGRPLRIRSRPMVQRCTSDGPSTMR
jgi:hypothetical protein